VNGRSRPKRAPAMSLAWPAAQEYEDCTNES
jgi:hypothetical protein